jgi:hypothetical protein
MRRLWHLIRLWFVLHSLRREAHDCLAALSPLDVGWQCSKCRRYFARLP